MKKYFALITALMIFISPFASIDSHAEGFEYDGIVYDLGHLDVNESACTYIDAKFNASFLDKRYNYNIKGKFCYLVLNASNGSSWTSFVAATNIFGRNGYPYNYNGTTLWYSNNIGGTVVIKEIASDMTCPLFYSSGATDAAANANWAAAKAYLIDGVLEGDIRDMLPPSAEEIGYLTDVKYFVDSAAYQYNPSDTPEFIQWGDKSTTGLDLTHSRYQVEFALEDKSSYYQNTVNDYISASGYDPTGNFGSWYREMRNYVGSLVFPSGSNARAVLQGKSVNTSFNGKFISAGSTAASNRQYRISAVARYLNGLSATIDADNLLESSDEWAFRNFLQGYSANPSRGYGGHLAQNISQLGRLYSMSYNIMARIVDSTSGAVGNWTKIDRHNTPYWDGAEEDTLNGRITRTDGYRYTVNNFGDTFVSGGGEDQTTEKKLVVIPVGYWDIDNNIGVPIHNNFNYSTNFDIHVGDVLPDIGDGGESGSDDIASGLGIIAAVAAIGGLFSILFSGVVPSWAITFCGVVFVAVIAIAVFKIVKGALPFV